MNKKNTTKRSLLVSALMLLVCTTMFVGSTFAWFTDSVTSSNNIIKSGTLDVAMTWADEVDGTYKDASEGAIFDYKLWEPGYTQVKYIKLENLGNLAFQYKLTVTPNILPTAGKANLADVIDVYTVEVKDGYTAPASFEEAKTSMTHVGTLADVLAATEGCDTGVILPKEGSTDVELPAGTEVYEEDVTVCIALHMQETAGNEYQNLSVGDGFSVQLLATQFTYEEDHFNNQYDKDLTPIEEGDILVEEEGIQYVYTNDGELVLYLIPENYAEDTVTLKEGTTSIGNYAFAYNNNVKTVNLPSTVRSLGRGFDSSNVEKVVLNEGLEVIDSRAFRSTPNLKEVVIPSTVKVIEDNAFQKSGIKEIVIPATVETIGEICFGSSKIETVTFEGNTAIQGYAFRGCPNLRTVYMNGDDVTMVPSTLNGRNSTWFCNGESNNPNTSNITFHVVNETVKERVLTAMGAERNNTTVIVK